MLARGNVIDRVDILLLYENQHTPGNTRWTDMAPLEAGWKQNIETLERSLVERALEAAQGNKSKAAEILGIHRWLLYEKLRQYDIDAKEQVGTSE